MVAPHLYREVPLLRLPFTLAAPDVMKTLTRCPSGPRSSPGPVPTLFGRKARLLDVCRFCSPRLLSFRSVRHQALDHA